MFPRLNRSAAERLACLCAGMVYGWKWPSAEFHRGTYFDEGDTHKIHKVKMAASGATVTLSLPRNFDTNASVAMGELCRTQDRHVVGNSALAL